MNSIIQYRLETTDPNRVLQENALGKKWSSWSVSRKIIVKRKFPVWRTQQKKPHHINLTSVLQEWQNKTPVTRPRSQVKGSSYGGRHSLFKSVKVNTSNLSWLQHTCNPLALYGLLRRPQSSPLQPCLVLLEVSSSTNMERILRTHSMFPRHQ